MSFISWFNRCGHKDIALVGRATARVGDPSGKSIERPELDLENVKRNTAGITSTLKRIIGGVGVSTSLKNLNNHDWLKDLVLLFLKNAGRFARVGLMIAKEIVKNMLESEQGMSYTNFTYRFILGYAFLHLFKEMHVSVQIYGSNQSGVTSLLRVISFARFCNLNHEMQILG